MAEIINVMFPAFKEIFLFLISNPLFSILMGLVVLAPCAYVFYRLKQL